MSNWKNTIIAALVLSLGAASPVLADDEMGMTGSDAAVDAEQPAMNDTPSDGASAMPIRYGQRGLTMPKGFVRGSVNLNVAQSGLPGADAVIGLGFGAGVSVLDNLELGLSAYRMGSTPAGGGLIPLFLSPDFDFGDIPLYARYRFVEGDTQIAIELVLNLPVLTDFGLEVNAPIRIGAGDSLAVDIAPGVSIVDLGGNTVIGINVPVQFVINITDAFFLKLLLGVSVDDLTDERGGKVGILVPAGLGGGYTVEVADNPLDIFAIFRWPALLSIRDGNFDANADAYQILIGANMHFDVFTD